MYICMCTFHPPRLQQRGGLCMYIMRLVLVPPPPPPYRDWNAGSSFLEYEMTCPYLFFGGFCRSVVVTLAHCPLVFVTHVMLNADPLVLIGYYFCE